MKKRITSLTVNGTKHDVIVRSNETLLEVLREGLNLTGTKFGCEHAECGACTVLVDGRPMLSCITLAQLHDGSDVRTVEGLSGDEYDKLELAFKEAGAAQCGYCTPGMVLMIDYARRHRSTMDVREAISGNLCRCTGFTKIIEAFENSMKSGNE